MNSNPPIISFMSMNRHSRMAIHSPKTNNMKGKDENEQITRRSQSNVRKKKNYKKARELNFLN